mgnify:CR=1 FL=1
MSVFSESIATFLGVIKAYLDDESVSEVLVNGPSEIFIERRGLLEKVDSRFKGSVYYKKVGVTIPKKLDRAFAKGVANGHSGRPFSS